AGSKLEVESAASWRGTPKLSRSINEVAHQRIFVVGDAAGYVEPFTGEGMAWAISGGIAIADCVRLLAEGQEQLAVDRWKQDWLNRVRSRQFWCRVLSWMLRHPSRARLGTRLMSTHPSIATTIAKQLGAAAH
ncbi:MAG: NAD-binding protein, partial [Planctomycetota bacterium]|nr:NAD-binding protein [Planctomycetota bacterium]